MAVEEAKLEDVGSGLAPVSPGWFVVNVAEAAWLRNDAFGGRCVFESNGRVLSERRSSSRSSSSSSASRWPCSSPASRPACTTRESSQEDFLVLAGTCLLLVEEQERRAARVGLRPLPARHEAHLRRHRRGPVRDLHDRRARRGRHDRLSGFGDGAAQAQASTPRRRAARSLCAVRPLAPGPAGGLVRLPWA